MESTVWNIPRAVSIPEELLRDGYTPLLATVLAARGADTAAAARAWLSDASEPSEDPFRLTDMDAAVRRIRLAQSRNETVAVYGDYDVDGITSACLLTEYLRGIGLNTEIYIPDRLAEGYGLNTDAVRRLHDRNVTLIITVDCGITAVEETDFAASLGIDMIITDHHECQAELPRAAAVVDPKRQDCSFTGRELAGVGVAYKLCCALEGGSDEVLRRFSDLVAVGTIADVMPLIAENRYITKRGLEKLRTAPRPGLAALMSEAGVAENRLSAVTVGYTLAPRINAAGRLGRVEHAARLILEHDPDTARSLAAELCAMNRERQTLEAQIWRQAEKMLDGQPAGAPIILAHEGWHQGVIGIVASRLSEAHSVPAIMISLDGDRGKGSCRSCFDFNLFDALTACGDLLEGFGGHALAAGLTLTRENVDAFRDAFCRYYAAHLPTEQAGVTPEILLSDPAPLTMEGVASLELLEPCGAGNPRPTFCFTGAELVSVTSIGGGKHTSLRLKKNDQIFGCVWFSQAADAIGAAPGDAVDVMFSPQINEYRGHRSVQLQVLAMRRADPAVLCRRVLDGEAGAEVSLNRGELACLWRSLDDKCPVSLSLAELGSLEPRLEPQKIALGLRVLDEVALAGLTVTADEVRVVLLPQRGKADLMQSAAWRRHHEQERS